MRTTLRILALLVLAVFPAKADGPAAIAAPGQILVTTVQAVGAQIYECRSDAAGKLVWQFREPIASLFLDGKTVGRHYAGPNWEMLDGSAVVAKVSGRAPAAGAGAGDIPLLRLDVQARRGAGQLTAVSTVQRINTRGGVAEGTCERPGAFLNVPYTADYTFYRRD